MQSLQQFIQFVIAELGTDKTLQAIFDAVYCDPDSKQAQELYAAFCAVKEKEKQVQSS